MQTLLDIALLVNAQDVVTYPPFWIATSVAERVVFQFEKTSIALLRRMRQWFEQSPIAEKVATESRPGPDVQSDDEILAGITATGATGSHAVATCAMGPDDDDIVDDRCRVRGIDGLRIVDCASQPTMISGNLMGPTMAWAGRAAEFILDGG